MSNVTAELSAFHKRLAKKEVGENSEHVEAHLISFKRWLASSPHLTVPQNDTFLLSFLRYAHYDHSTAQRRLDNFCTLRCSDKVISKWYNYPSLGDPLLDSYLNAGIFVPIGFTESGLYVITIRLGAWKLNEIEQVQLRTMNNMSFERFILDQRCQIGGYAILVDMSDTDSETLRKWSELKYAKSAFKLMQESSPARVKHIIFYNEGKMVDFAFKVSETWMSEKLKERVLRVKTDINKAFKKIPGLKEALPTEYGGMNGSIADAIERNKQALSAFYSDGDLLHGIQVNEEKRPDTAKNFINEYKEYDAVNVGKKGTYISVDPGD